MSDNHDHLAGLIPVALERETTGSLPQDPQSMVSEEHTANNPKQNFPNVLWHPHAGLVVSPNMDFVPRASAATYRCDDEGKATLYTAPSLVDDQSIYLVFCPTHAENSGDLFGRLNLTEENIRGKIVKSNDYYSLNPAIVGSWERLETGLVDVASTLLKMLPRNVPRLTWPRLPEHCGYRNFHQKERYAIASASKSIKAFRFLGAFISFALALHMDTDGDVAHVYDNVRMRSSLNPEASWLDLLAISQISNFTPNFRIGGFINPYTSRWLSHIEKFVQAGVPVWLLWGPKKKEHAPLDKRALAYWPPDRVVDNARLRSLATTTVVLPTYRYDPFAMNKGAPLAVMSDPATCMWLSPQSPSPMPQSPSPSNDPASPYHRESTMDETADGSPDSFLPPQPEVDVSQAPREEPAAVESADSDSRAKAITALDDFFAERGRRREARLAIETPAEKQRREQREAHVAKTKLYSKKCTMYMWVEQADGSYVREQVFSKQFEVEWDNFTANQRRYTGHLNEWDLCPQYPRYSEEFPREADSDDDYSGEDEGEDCSTPPTLNRVPIPVGGIVTPTAEDEDAEHTRQMPATDNIVYFGAPHVERPLFGDFIKYRVGCDLFSGSNWTSVEGDRAVTAEKAIMAISFRPESLPAGPEIRESLVQVARILSRSSAFTFKDLPNSFDHGVSNGIKLEPSTLEVTSTTATEGTVFLIHPPGYGERGSWAIATSRASTVLQIFRRGWGTVDVIARELARQGACFSTVEASAQRSNVSPPILPRRGLGYRPANFQPTTSDYEEYLRRREDLLRGPRGRAALMHGGIVARIARDVLEVDSVLHGPSHTAVTVGQHGRYTLFDDRLTLDDLDVICGVYYMHNKGVSSTGGRRGDGSHTHLSWWPQASTWDSSHCFMQTEWTELAEDFYQKWLGYRRQKLEGTVFGAASWRKKMRKQNAVTAAIEGCIEHYQSGYLHDRLQSI